MEKMFNYFNNIPMKKFNSFIFLMSMRESGTMKNAKIMKKGVKSFKFTP